MLKIILVFNFIFMYENSFNPDLIYGSLDFGRDIQAGAYLL